MDRDTAEWLLGGGPGHPAGSEPLVRLLTAASASARPHELAGEDAAVAHFRWHQAAPAPRSGRRAPLARLLTVKVTVALAVTVGGVAVAAAAGGLPDLGGRSSISARPAPVPDLPPTTRPARHGDGAAGASPSARPELVDLCRELAARKDPAKAAGTPPFTPLVAAAGGADRVPSYCDQLLQVSGDGGATPPGVSPSPAPTAGPPDKPDHKPGQPPQERGRTSHPPHPPHPPHPTVQAGPGLDGTGPPGRLPPVLPGLVGSGSGSAHR